MAYVTGNHDSTPFMDKLSHSIIKETSKSLKYYLDVKRRENAFILSPSVSSWDSLPTKARFLYGTTKEYPPLYASYYTDSDVKTCLRAIQQQHRSLPRTSSDLERRICREELHFHMRPEKPPIAAENRQFSRLNLQGPRRANSSSNGSINRLVKSSLSRSTSYENNSVVNETADILANLIKSRRNMSSSNYSSRQDTHAYVSRNTNPSPRQTDEPDSSVPNEINGSTAPINLPRPQKPKRKTDDPSAKNLAIMRESRSIIDSILCDYKITVTTGNCNGASTDAPIQIKLYGKKGSTEFIHLEQSETHRVPFRRNQSDSFTIKTSHVGELAGITIGHDQLGAKSSWFLSQVVIEDTVRQKTYEIQCNSWLSSRSNDQKTMRDFPVTPKVSRRQSSSSSEKHRGEIRRDSDRSPDAELPERPMSKRSNHHSPHKNLNSNRQNHSLDQRSSPPSTPSPRPPNKSSKKVVDSPVLSRSPSPPGESTSATTNHHGFSFKKTTEERTDSPREDYHRPPSRLDDRSSSSPPQIEKKKKDDEEENSYEDDFFN